MKPNEKRDRQEDDEGENEGTQIELQLNIMAKDKQYKDSREGAGSKARLRSDLFCRIG